MAVIKIPAKHIYGMQNEKVIDNDIDKIEVTAKEIVPDNIYSDPVYNTSVYYGTGEKTEWYSQQYRPSKSADYPIDDNYNSLDWVSLCVGAYIKDTYFSYTIKVPKSVKNRHITRIIQNTNDDIGIRKSIVETVYYDTVSNGIETSLGLGVDTNNITNHNYSNIIKKTTIENFTKAAVYFNSAIELTDVNNIASKFEVDRIEYHDEAYVVKCELYDSNLQKTLTYDISAIGFDDYDSISNFTEEDDYYVFSVKTLFLREIYAPATTVAYLKSQGHAEYYPCKVIKIEQRAEEIDFTIYGDAVGIDFQDKTITIGDGKNVISFSGNELMQTTNNPTLQAQYEKVLTEWEDGKETATLTCGIADYYATDGLKAISMSKSNGLPMTFHVGDIVCPYVFGSNGQERPMSTNKDGTPKNFVVIKKRPYGKSPVWQELGLQEYKGDVATKPSAIIQLIKQNIVNNDITNISCVVIDGFVNSGDILYYNGEAARASYGLEYLMLQASADGEFASAIGQTITVTKNEQ